MGFFTFSAIFKMCEGNTRTERNERDRLKVKFIFLAASTERSVHNANVPIFIKTEVCYLLVQYGARFVNRNPVETVFVQLQDKYSICR